MGLVLFIGGHSRAERERAVAARELDLALGRMVEERGVRAPVHGRRRQSGQCSSEIATDGGIGSSVAQSSRELRPPGLREANEYDDDGSANEAAPFLPAAV